MEYYLFKGEGRKKFIIPKNMVIFIFLAILTNSLGKYPKRNQVF